MSEREIWKLRIYLAGYSKDLEYREIVKEKYEHKAILIDPMTITGDDIIDNSTTKLDDIWLVKRDKRLIDECDILVAHIEYKPYGEIMIGTLMEIIHAFHKGIPCFVISSEEYIRENPWLTFHIRKAFKSIDDCFDYILK